MSKRLLECLLLTTFVFLYHENPWSSYQALKKELEIEPLSVARSCLPRGAHVASRAFLFWTVTLSFATVTLFSLSSFMTSPIVSRNYQLLASFRIAGEMSGQPLQVVTGGSARKPKFDDSSSMIGSDRQPAPMASRHHH
jgi:hypothetical protein